MGRSVDRLAGTTMSAGRFCGKERKIELAADGWAGRAW